MHLCNFWESAGGCGVQSSFLHQFQSQPFLHRLSSVITLHDRLVLWITIDFGLGRDDGSGATRIVLVLDGDEGSTMAGVVLLLFFDSTPIIPLESSPFRDSGVDENGSHFFSVSQLPLGLLDFSDLVADLLSIEGLPGCERNVNWISQAWVVHTDTDLVPRIEMGKESVQDLVPNSGRQLENVVHPPTIPELDGTSQTTGAVSSVPLMIVRDDIVKFTDIRFWLVLNSVSLSTFLNEVGFQHP
ncbi:MAG: hypothetical protein GY696_27120, partial [Gammaproteobacteria bacterium]|nr:hypothetical protein [Gammaproteobacteria bacterium]